VKLSKLVVNNFGCWKRLELQLGNMHALVGENNAGKSTILKAIEFLVDSAYPDIDSDSFWGGDTRSDIQVEGTFSDLTHYEKDQSSEYLRQDGTLWIRRSAICKTEDSANVDGKKIKLERVYEYSQEVPEVEWLRRDMVTKDRIDVWWKKEDLTIGDVSFRDLFDSCEKVPTISQWNDGIKEFISLYHDAIPMRDEWHKGDRRFEQILKKVLPQFILIPAVKDVSEEVKVKKTSPFGVLLNHVLSTIDADEKLEINKVLDAVGKKINRQGGEDSRIIGLQEIERKLSERVKGYSFECSVEIEFDLPTIEDLLSSPKVYVNDGFRIPVEKKGHGLQRALIFSILGAYAEHIVQKDHQEKEKSGGLIFAVEEPEIYMHPQAQRTIYETFNGIADSGAQVIFSTHSPVFVDVTYFDQVIRVETGTEYVKDRGQVQSSKAWQLSMERFAKHWELGEYGDKSNDVVRSVRERLSHICNPQKNEGYFAKKIILVEGETESYSIPIYAKAVLGQSLDSLGISVIAAGGKNNIENLYTIYNEFRIPCYVLFDYDKDSSDKDKIDTSKRLLLLLGIGEVEIDDKTSHVFESGAFFTEEWEKCVNAEIAEQEGSVSRGVPEFKQLKEEAIKKLGTNSKPLVAMYIAKSLTDETPPFVPPTVEDVIKKAVEVEWKRSCLRGT